MVVRQYDKGIYLQILVTEDGTNGVNISTATTKQLILKPPRGAYIHRAADFSTDGTDGLLRYLVVDELDGEAGPWRLYGKVIMPDGKNLRGYLTLTVEPAPE